ncbi:MAG: glycosyltransferase [Candidatus Helarchaeota archaeon]|nr:glycosyltransferase [Candidatus Helarchaeota archaeon]
MRIAMFSEVPTFNPVFPNGVASFIEAVSKQLVKLGHEVHVYEPCQHLKQKKIVKIHDKITKHHLFSLSGGKYKNFRVPMPFGLIFKRMKEEKFDTIHAHGPMNGVAATLLAKKQNCPKLITYHTPGEHYRHYAPRFLPVRYKFFTDLAERLIYNSFDMMLTPAEAIRKDLIRKGYKEERLFVLPNCVNLHENHKRITEERMQQLRDEYTLNGKKIVLYVGRMSPEKRIPDIINLAPQIVKEEPDTHFLMVGKGPYLNKYRTLAHKVAPNDMTFTGYVTDEDLSNLLRMSSLGVIFVDGAQVFDITLLNYWANRLPVCARRAGGMGDVISHADNGMLFREPSEAFDQMLSLLQDEKLCRKMGSKGYETVKRKYSVEVVTDLMLRYYDMAARKFHRKDNGVLSHFKKFIFKRKKK